MSKVRSDYDVDLQNSRDAMREDRERDRYYRALRRHAAVAINALNKAKKEIDGKPENYTTNCPDFLGELVACLTEAQQYMQVVEDFYTKDCSTTVNPPRITPPPQS